ncbi:hypothetical protein IC617_03900 [Neiella sp. HB171785]|uniref:Uncharacterized protein n=1 Tax=Neiella litorisoli TaxID=2771431 RepID=A0A8J6UPJ2_9GAMM|nr:hypothetical protein [Neiella litorisoli]MBD1388562.1 hypothetical protein [Neiella litorisoli]
MNDFTCQNGKPIGWLEDILVGVCLAENQKSIKSRKRKGTKHVNEVSPSKVADVFLNVEGDLTSKRVETFLWCSDRHARRVMERVELAALFISRDLELGGTASKPNPESMTHEADLLNWLNNRYVSEEIKGEVAGMILASLNN